MKWMKLIIFVIIVVLLLIFVVQNVGQPVKLVFFSKSNTFESEMIVVVLVALIIGVIIGTIFSVFQIMAAKNRIRVVLTENRKLQKELNLLRNVDVEESETEENKE